MIKLVPNMWAGHGVLARMHFGMHVMKTILHLGVHRTASTTFQNYLDQNTRHLATYGVAVWTPKTLRRSAFSTMVRPPLKEGGEYVAPTAQVADHCAALQGRQTRMLLVSEENMTGTVRVNFRDATLYPEIYHRLARFSTIFGQTCQRIILSIRSYDTFWASSLAYAHTAGFGQQNTDKMRAIGNDPRGWQDVIDDVASAFPRAEIVVAPYESFGGRCHTVLNCATQSLGLMHKPATAMRLNASKYITHGGFDLETRRNLRLRYADDLAWLANGADGLARLLTQRHQNDMDENGIGRLGIIRRPAQIGENYGTIRQMV